MSLVDDGREMLTAQQVREITGLPVQPCMIGRLSVSAASMPLGHTTFASVGSLPVGPQGRRDMTGIHPRVNPIRPTIVVDAAGRFRRCTVKHSVGQSY